MASSKMMMIDSNNLLVATLELKWEKKIQGSSFSWLWKQILTFRKYNPCFCYIKKYYFE